MMPAIGIVDAPERVSPREIEHRERVCYAVARAGEAYGLSPSEVVAMQAIAIGNQTWTSVGILTGAGIGTDVLDGLKQVRGYDGAGWVEEFPLEDGPALTFTPWAIVELDLEAQEYWDVCPVIAEQEDCSGEKTTIPVREPHEVPRWTLRPPPREPGMPKAKLRPLRLPTRYQLGWLTEDVIRGLVKRTVPDPAEEVMRKEERERAMVFVFQESRTETGALDVDPSTGQVRVEPVTLWAPPANDGLKGGVADPHGGKIPYDERMGKAKKPGKKKRRRRRSA